MKLLSRNQVKWIAFALMICDHVGHVFSRPWVSLWPWLYSGSDAWIVMRLFFGRISYPLFCMLFVEGFLHIKRKNRIKHLATLIAFALVSEPAFELALYGSFSFGTENVMFSWALAFILLWIAEECRERIDSKVLWLVLLAVLVALFCRLAIWMDVDYSSTGIIAVTLVYLACSFGIESPWVHGLLSGGTDALLAGTPCAALAVVVAAFYDPNKPCKRSAFQKYWFYVGYPAHLYLLYLITLAFPA